MTSRLDNRSAIITGGAQGLGFAIAQRLLAEGASVTLWDVNAQVLAEARQQLAGLGKVAVFAVDITDEASVDAAAAAADAAGSGFDILVHSAGISGPTMPTADYPREEWRRVLDINLYGAFLVNQVVVRRMIANNYGRIVNIASIAGKEGNPNASAYSAAKAGLIGLTKSLGKETAALDISVNVITPAAAKTRILEQVSQQHIDYMLSKIPRGRFLLVEEVASMVSWLVSAENSFTTGAVFDLSGGRATY
ncbi:3-oxoacyl-ACP reductase [Devosia epidermidihirudinis]|uniref:3-oxoacyl-ACP reductase n=1 Tax=Devosia epidermidihirudinis TaxID=1293439 RepID=A0A0F5QAP2_9HYPH|nr:SDR family NAD(P)-dependent oxidoreductase [Devosia epidermidihirudinis]KKC37796.1 3-oxoacyl-ACP reductase [Devosia epidermidihirudinis]